MTTSLLLHLDGADGGTTILDTSQFPGKTVTAMGDAQLDTGIAPKFGTASLLLDGVGDYLAASAHADFQPAIGSSWTVEGWMRAGSPLQTGGIFYFGSTGSDTNRMMLYMGSDGTLNFYMNQGGSWFGPLTTVGGIVTAGVWQHFAITKVGSVVSIYHNGARRHTWDFGFTGNFNNTVFSLGVSRAPTGGVLQYFKGSLDEVRYTKDVAIYTGTSYTIPAAPFTDPVTVSYGTPTLYTSLTVINSSIGTPTLYTKLAVHAKRGTPTLYTKLMVTANGTPTLYTRLAVLDPGNPTTWTARCLIDGVDVSATLTGTLWVEADEGASRIAGVTILPPVGVIDPLDYVGRAITLDFVRKVGAVEIPMRLFTGRVDTPVYNPGTRLLDLSCVDDLQNRISVLSIADIDTLIGGRYSSAVQGDDLDLFDYAKARLTTVAASLDGDANGALRLTPWQLSGVWKTYADNDLLDGASSITLPQRTSIVNQVNIRYSYRYPHLRQRYAVVSLSCTRNEMHRAGYTYPVKDEIESACSGSGWVQTIGIYYPAPVTIPHLTGGVVRPRVGAVDMAIIHLTQRHGQAVSDEYEITVHAPESITQNGVLPHELRGAAEDEFDYQVWESDLTVPPLFSEGGEADYTPNFTPAQSDYAIQTLLDQARVKILETHRGARVSNTTLCDPLLDLDKRVRIMTPEIDSSGKVSHIRHALDINQGSAVTEFSIAVFGAGGAGLITPSVMDAPAATAPQIAAQNWLEELPFLSVNVYGGTPYNDNLMGLLLNPQQFYTVEDVPDGLGGFATESYENPFYVVGSYPSTGIRVEMPGVDETDRNPVSRNNVSVYDVVIPPETINLTRL